MDNGNTHDYSNITENKNAVITVDASSSDHSTCKAVWKVLLFVGSTITFFRNLICNLIFLLLLLAVYMACQFSSTFDSADRISVSTIKKENAVNPLLYFDLSGSIHENPEPDNDYTRFTKQFSEYLDVPEYHDVLSIERALILAASDKKIKSVLFDFSKTQGMSLALANRIKKAISSFKEHNRHVKVTAYADSYTATSYLIANACDKIVLNPLGGFSFRGFASSSLYFKDLFNRFKVTPLVFRAGEFKSAVEPFTSDRMSDEVKEEYQNLFSKLWISYQSDLNQKFRKGSKIAALYSDAESYLSMLVDSDGNEASLLKKLKLVDTLQSKEELYAGYVKKFGSTDNFLTPKSTSYKKYLELRSADEAEKSSTSSIAVIYGIGEITQNTNRPEDFTPENISNVLNRIAKNKNIRIVLFYLNSPGGSVWASEQIRNQIIEFKKKTGLPVYVSMNGMAASGAYWISTAADYIFASPQTITGSIGVFSLGFAFDELLNEYGVYEDGVETSELSRRSVARKMPESQKVEIEISVLSIYKRFLSLVTEKNPSLKNRNFRDYAEGRVFLSDDALSLNLIDEVASFEDKLAELKVKFAGDDKLPLNVIHYSADEINSNTFIKNLMSSYAKDSELVKMVSQILLHAEENAKGSTSVNQRIMAVSPIESPSF
ncbi:MAG: signal peptide peptidase SppA [Succinivibrio sp.]